VTATLEELDRKVMRLARDCGRRTHAPVFTARQRPANPDETLSDLVLDATTSRLVRQVRLEFAGPIRAAIATRTAYVRARRVGRATKNTVKGVARGALLLARAPQLLVTWLVVLLIVALVYYLWVGARKVEWLTGKIVPSSCQTTHRTGFLWFGSDDDGSGTSFVDFTGAMGGYAAGKLHGITASREAAALHWVVTTTTRSVVVLRHTISGGSYTPPAAPQPAPTAEPTSSTGCCGSGPTTGVPASYPTSTATTMVPAAYSTSTADAGTLTPDQVSIARTIITEGKAAGAPSYGWVVALATALQESNLTNLLGGSGDSVGVFQQITAWGPGRTDPAGAARMFYTGGVGGQAGLLDIAGWPTMTVTAAAQAVQRSAYPTAYADDEPLARQLVTAYGGAGATPVGLPCGQPAGGTFTGPGGPFPPETCSVVPDQSTGRGCLTPRTLALYLQLKAQGYTGISCWDEHAWNPNSDHPLGKACDVTMGTIGVKAADADKARGDALNAALLASGAETGVAYTIWSGTYCPVGGTCRPYSGGGVYDPSSPTGGHYDHVHVSVQ